MTVDSRPNARSGSGLATERHPLRSLLGKKHRIFNRLSRHRENRNHASTTMVIVITSRAHGLGTDLPRRWTITSGTNGCAEDLDY